MSLVPSSQVLTASRLTLYTMNSEFHTPVEWFLQIMYKTVMEGTFDKHKKILNQIGWYFRQNAEN